MTKAPVVAALVAARLRRARDYGHIREELYSMIDQKNGKFAVRGVLRESLALFFSKNFFVFASVPFFLRIVQLLIRMLLSSGFTNESVLWNAAVFVCWLLLCGFIFFSNKKTFIKNLRASIIYVFYRRSALKLLSLVRKCQNSGDTLKKLFILASALFLISAVQGFVRFSFFYYAYQIFPSVLTHDRVLIAHNLLSGVGVWMRWLLSYGFVAYVVLQTLSRGSPSFSESLSRLVRRLHWFLLAAIILSLMAGTIGAMSYKMLEPTISKLLEYYDTSYVMFIFYYFTVITLLLLCVCPLWLAVPAFITENTGIKSLNRSISLTKGYYWAVFFLIMSVWLCDTITMQTSMRAFRLVFSWLGDDVFYYLLSLSSILLKTAVMTLSWIVGVVAYCRLRVVKEGVSFEEMDVPL